MKEQNTHVTYTRSELDALSDETDWERVDALTDEDIEKAALSGPDDPPTDADFWKDATVVMPENMKEGIMKDPFKVFITYSHTNSHQEEELKVQLAPLEEEGIITIWDDCKILPGDRWENAIFDNLADAELLLYLVSDASLDSPNCNRELAEALGMAIRVIPIFLEECNWQNHNLAGFQGLPERGRPISQWKDQSSAWRSIVDGIRRLATALPSRAELLFDQGLLLQQLGQFEKSIQRYSRAIQLNPNLCNAYNNRGAAYSDMGDDQQAIKDYNKEIGLYPDYATPYINRGNAYYRKRDYEQAVKDYNKAIELDPDCADTYNNRGVAYGNTGDYEQAIRDCNKAIELDPDYAIAYSNRGEANYFTGDYEQAIGDCNKAIELDPDCASAYRNRGNAYYSKRDYEQAIGDCNKAIELDPDYAIAYNDRGAAYSKTGDYEQAIRDYNKAIELDPDCAIAYRNRGNAYNFTGDYEQAIRDHNKAEELSRRL